MNNLTPQQLKAIPALKDVPIDQLQWFINEGVVIELEEGERLFNTGDPINNTFIILEGRIRMCAVQNGKLREITVVDKDGISGYLPFSRANKAIGYGECVKKARIFKCAADKVNAGIKLHYELTEALVHIMTSRVRDFTSLQQQNEKMFALGKLSAGLAHELNNPAAAINRGASALKDRIQRMPDMFKATAGLNILPEKIDRIHHILQHKLTDTNQPVLSMLQMADREDELTDWLLDHDISELDMAENFAGFGFTPADMEHLSSCTPAPQLNVVLKWMNNYLLAEKLVADITQSSHQISELVSSVKTFTHMDKATDKQLLDIHAGIRNSLTMLNYKLKKNSITIKEEFDLTLPEVKALAGEMNQVWTNIIDNAMDAMETNGKGILEITTRLDGEFVCVYIKDNGPGIPADIQSKIFDPFFTTKDMGKGTGLGLDVVTRIIRQHNGTVRVTSEPGNTVFTVCFPLTDN
ncbi:ATP-binding protein [Mucilaginibacter segetis]|uniref:histidine kinase n=1 Tax=Mucilaginibacter segetis TaxID=2793071 RepID=A0A934PVU7_9SPHI|nr:ATP-binding protein [Mucilaginibacter segetis]MBK0380592.1 GHKL domain-containing protein [Mucilaginibacter segetis]